MKEHVIVVEWMGINKQRLSSTTRVSWMMVDAFRDETLATWLVSKMRDHVLIAKSEFGEIKHEPMTISVMTVEEMGPKETRKREPVPMAYFEALKLMVSTGGKPLAPIALDEHERYVIHTIGLGEGFNKIPTSLIQKGMVQVGTSPASDGKSVYPEFQLTELGQREFNRGHRL